MKHPQQEKQEAIEKLRNILKPGDTVHTVLRHVSSSGMSRRIDLYKFEARDGKVVKHYLSYWVAQACGWKCDADTGAIKVSGCGMDMGFHLVYTLGRVLYPEGFNPSPIGMRPIDGKRVNIDIGRGKGAGPLTRAEVDAHTAKGWEFIDGRNGDKSGWDNDCGYALNHEWL